MSERITSQMLTGSTLTDLGTSLAAMERSASELSSGKSIQQPSDNPYGASHAINLQSTIDGLNSYASNVQDGQSWLSTASSSLSSINSVGQRVRELLLEASSGINEQADLNSIAGEVDQLTEAVKQDANTQYAGQYVFSGTLTETPPYEQGASDEYQGNNGTITREIGPSSSVTVNASLSSVLGNGQASGDGKLLDTLRTISQDLRSGSTEGRSALSKTDLNNLDSNLESLNQLQAVTGAATDQMNVAASRIEDLKGTTAETLSGVQDVDFATASINYSNEQAAYDAALRAGASIVQQSLLEFLH